MSWPWVLLAAIGGAFIGYAIGLANGLERIQRAQRAAENTAIAVFATTVELTYGNEFLSDLLDECKLVMESHPDLIVETAKRMSVVQGLREVAQEKGIKL